MVWAYLINNSILLIRDFLILLPSFFFTRTASCPHSFYFPELTLNPVYGKNAVLSDNDIHIRLSFPKTKVLSIRICFFFFKGPRESIHSPSRHNLTASSFSYLHDFVSQNKPLRENT